ncbi:MULTISPECIES: hypothetical protein [unclassified Streptomyces]|uniref:hypothetical protein n=1 Tax=unclassified Streptomyces TaxID=2593676 RepID=UPI002E0FA60F|nr:MULTISPECIES: hypothetical protein [unclassified Streptomyces]WSR19702.1 hypothetical protein OG457_44350 [Streptomyces sp. NBC_01207]WTA23860.1 hypothetical protein OG365_38020 [Streptomyces sp. NBC_00853]
MNDLTAVDVLVDPDETTLRHAHAWNARMRESVPDGFALDASHRPHITTLQRYVRTADLDDVYDAVHRTLAATDTSALSYQAVAVKHADWGVPGQGLAVILLRPGPQVLDFQAALLAALAPFTRSGGTAAAFVTDPGEAISDSTLDWVDGYVPAQIGPDRYTAHITVGFATLDDLEAIEAEPFDAFAVRPAGVAVYQLGNSGAARTLLRSWPVPN